MVRNLTEYLLDEFANAGWLVPYGTAYRVAERLLAKQEECSKELVPCNNCKHYEMDCGYCEHTGATCKFDDFCSYGERREGE